MQSSRLRIHKIESVVVDHKTDSTTTDSILQICRRLLCIVFKSKKDFKVPSNKTDLTTTDSILDSTTTDSILWIRRRLLWCSYGKPFRSYVSQLFSWNDRKEKKKFFFDQHLSFYPSFYVRYVDDVFAIFNFAIEVQMFLEVLNNQHPNLRFTCEEASGPSLPFLDVQLTICNRDFNICV